MKAIQDQEDLLSLKSQGTQSTTKVTLLSRLCTQHSTHGNDFSPSKSKKRRLVCIQVDLFVWS